MRKTNEGASPVRPVLFGATAGLLATLVLMRWCAVLVHQGTLGEELIPHDSRSPVWWPDGMLSPRSSRRGVCPDGRLAIAVAGGPVVLILLTVCALVAARRPIRSHSRQSALCSRGLVLGTAAGIYMRTKTNTVI